MANWSLPTTTDIIANIIAFFKNRDVDLALGLDPANTAPTNIPDKAIRWNSAAGKWQLLTTGVWGDLIATYAIAISGAAGAVPWSGVSGKPTTLGGYGITDAQPLDGDLTAIAALGTTGFARRTGSNTWTLGDAIVTADIGNDQVTYAKIQNVTATDRLLGRSTVGAGDIEEIVCTAAGRAIIDDADAAAQRATLGLGGVAVKSFPLLMSIWIPAGAMIARTTNGSVLATVESATNKIMVRSQDFDQTTIQYAQFTVTMPKNWDEGTVKARFTWRNVAGSGDVIWGCQAVAVSDADAVDAAPGTAIEVTDTSNGTTVLNQSADTGSITIAGSPAARDTVFFQVYRNAAAGGDTLGATSSLVGVEIFYNIDDLSAA